MEILAKIKVMEVNITTTNGVKESKRLD